ncbi:exported hypothetical protein [Candidatus Desulfarcum epimagneticum]|uniref:Cohesin domain-containing protein n=1 Tax=uncultured Desulfobacteraceae bacterium TaxID=218296 RepID=A0A484HLM2_9BACT|nr:exported hypothetical protein [uncultured Desulfobacteraceae bacterium]
MFSRKKKNIFLCLVVGLSLFLIKNGHANSQNSSLEAIRQSYYGGGQVTYEVCVKNYPKSIDSLGMDVVYNPANLTLRRYERGSLTTNFDVFAVTNNAEAGVLRIGGIEAGNHIISKGSSGSIVILDFDVVGNLEPDTKLRFQGLKDDLNPKSRTYDPKREEPEKVESPSPASGSDNSGINEGDPQKSIDDNGSAESSYRSYTRNKGNGANEQQLESSEAFPETEVQQTESGSGASAQTRGEQKADRSNIATFKKTDHDGNIFTPGISGPSSSGGEKSSKKIWITTNRTKETRPKKHVHNATLKDSPRNIKKNTAAAFEELASNIQQIKNSVNTLKIIVLFLCFIIMSGFVGMFLLIKPIINREAK